MAKQLICLIARPDSYDPWLWLVQAHPSDCSKCDGGTCELLHRYQFTEEDRRTGHAKDWHQIEVTASDIGMERFQGGHVEGKGQRVLNDA